MELLPHIQFSKLRIDQFLPAVEIFEDDTGMEQTLLGFNRCRHYFSAQDGDIGFFYPDTPPRVLAAIDLSVQGGFPPDAVQRIISACAPPLRLGMRAEEVLALFGKPEHDGSRNDYRFFRFRVGKKWPYRVLASFERKRGLWSMGIVREDYFVEDDN
jgi:hypothetical protein